MRERRDEIARGISGESKRKEERKAERAYLMPSQV
jgi:hypothetical protein